MSVHAIPRRRPAVVPRGAAVRAARDTAARAGHGPGRPELRARGADRRAAGARAGGAGGRGAGGRARGGGVDVHRRAHARARAPSSSRARWSCRASPSPPRPTPRRGTGCARCSPSATRPRSSSIPPTPRPASTAPPPCWRRMCSGRRARPSSWRSWAAAHGIPVVFDAAHAHGARRRGRRVGGLGDAEVFSMTPTKLVIAGEGGLVATNRADVAAAVRIGRDYGNPGDYDTRFVGLNARLSEMHAATALESLADLDENLARAEGRSWRALSRRTESRCPASTCRSSTTATSRRTRTSPSASTRRTSACRATEPSPRSVREASTRAATSGRRCTASTRTVRWRADRCRSPTTSPDASSACRSFPGSPLDAVDAVVAILAGVHEHAEEVREAIAR